MPAAHSKVFEDLIREVSETIIEYKETSALAGATERVGWASGIMFVFHSTGYLRVLILLVLLATFMSCGGDGATSQDIVAAMELNRRGLQALRFKDFDRARELFEKAHRLDRERADYLNNAGIAYMRQKKFGMAIRNFQKAVQANRFYARGHYNLGVCYQKLNKDRAAVAAYKKALALAPASFLVHYNLGLVYSRMGDKTEARKSFTRFLKAAPAAMKGPRLDAARRLKQVGG